MRMMTMIMMMAMMVMTIKPHWRLMEVAWGLGHEDDDNDNDDGNDGDDNEASLATHGSSQGSWP